MFHLQQNSKNWESKKGEIWFWRAHGEHDSDSNPCSQNYSSWDEKIGIIQLETTEVVFLKNESGLYRAYPMVMVSLAMLGLMRPFGKLFDIISFFKLTDCIWWQTQSKIMRMKGLKVTKPSEIFWSIPSPSLAFVPALLQNHWCHQILKAASSGFSEF